MSHGFIDAIVVNDAEVRAGACFTNPNINLFQGLNYRLISFLCNALDLLSTMTIDLNPSEYDEEQIRLMEERCIVTDTDDKALRDGSKKECKSIVTIQGSIY